MRPPRVGGTRPHCEAVLHHPQRKPGELVSSTPSNIPSGLVRYRQGLGHQGRLADAGFALDPDNRSLAAAERFHGSAENPELMLAANPLRRPDRPH